MKNYVVVVDKLYTYRLEVQAEDEESAEALALLVLDVNKVYDYNESTCVVEDICEDTN